MIKIEKTEVVGWEAAIRGMRNPMNSWEKSDSGWCRAQKDGMMCECCLYFVSDECTNPHEGDDFCVGKNDYDLMLRLIRGGPTHAKFRRMIIVYADITAPLYWWKEYDTYKVGTVANSCSTMHKIAEKEFTVNDFSVEHLGVQSIVKNEETEEVLEQNLWSDRTFLELLDGLNIARKFYLKEEDPDLKKQYWWQMIQLLPTSYNQKRTVMLSYEVLANIYRSRMGHKLDEWHDFCYWISTLPYSPIITTCGKGDKE